MQRIKMIRSKVILTQREHTNIQRTGFDATGDAPTAIAGQPGTKSLISPPKFVKIVIKLPAELIHNGATMRLRCNQDNETAREGRERVIVLIFHEL